MKNIFNSADAAEVAARINKLKPESEKRWGTMNAAQMLAHCNVTYELVYEDKHPKPKGLMKFMLKNFVKKYVTTEIPYKKSSRTAPAFIIKGNKDFEAEKARLLAHINKTQELGEKHFHNKESHSFGVLTTAEWNTMFYKHLDHHLSQFGV